MQTKTRDPVPVFTFVPELFVNAENDFPRQFLDIFQFKACIFVMLPIILSRPKQAQWGLIGGGDEEVSMLLPTVT